MKMCVDGSFLLYRARFIVEKAGKESVDKFEVASIFMTSLLRVIETYAPTQIYVLFDDGRSEHRRKLHPEYKAQRDALKDENNPGYRAYLEARDFLFPRLRSLGFVSVIESGIEADDFAYFIAAEPYTQGIHITEDHDWYLNLFEEWGVYHPRADKLVTYNDLVTMTQYEFNPRAAFLVAKAMVGDPSDNIPGVKGIGWSSAQKIAIKLLNGESLGDGTRAQLVQENREIINRNMAIMNPEWVRDDARAKHVLIKAELDTLTVSKPAIRWAHFCGGFPKGPIRSGLLNWVQRYNTIMRKLAI
jgi:DNA polymerase I